MPIDAALDYVKKHDLHALLIQKDGRLLQEEYAPPYDAEKPHALYSGTKSFWGIAALAAAEDGLLDLDEPLVGTLHEWRDDPSKARITGRMLLTLTAGYGFGGLGSAVPTYERALTTPLKDIPGTTFTYGGIPLQIFGAYFTRVLAARGLEPHAYLRQRILEPANVDVATWRTLRDGTHPLPTGAFLTARAWLAYGDFVLAQRERFRAAFVPSTVNPRYGLGWWLGSAHAPPDLVYASGSGGQALYIVPSASLVVVHFGGKASYNHDAFLRRLFG